MAAEVFKAIDFMPLIAYERQRRVVPLVKALDEAGFSADSLDRLVSLQLACLELLLICLSTGSNTLT